MKVTIDKCERCGAIFEDEVKYNEHIETHKVLDIFEAAFPSVKNKGCRFANGEWNVPRDKSWYERFKKRLVEIVGDIGYEPFSYGWYRSLNDSNSPYDGLAYRFMCICPFCYREWGQPYYANHCNHKDKKE